MSKKEDDPWLGPIGGWIPLSEVLEAARVRLGVPKSVTSEIVRDVVRRGGLSGRVIGWDYFTREHLEMGKVVTRHHELPEGEQDYLTRAGWHRVELRSGTLGGHEVEVAWQEVTFLLRDHIDEPSAQPPRNTGGRSSRPDWDIFWVEVARYAALNGLDPQYRRELQQHMARWAAENMTDPVPDDATIRGRLRLLYEPRKTPEG